MRKEILKIVAVVMFEAVLITGSVYAWNKINPPTAPAVGNVITRCVDMKMFTPVESMGLVGVGEMKLCAENWFISNLYGPSLETAAPDPVPVHPFNPEPSSPLN